ncbi:MAG: hypothetical protein QW514_08525 [Thermoprotei archaeon]
MGYAGGGLDRPSANRWSKEQFEYQLSVYRLVRAVLKVFGEGKIFFNGSLAMNTYFDASERRIVTGVDVVVTPTYHDIWSKAGGGGLAGLNNPQRVCGLVNREFGREESCSDINVNGVSVRLGCFESFNRTADGRLRLMALVEGGHMTFKKSFKLLPSSGSKLAYLDGDRSLSELKVSPLFLDVRLEEPYLRDQSQVLTHKWGLTVMEYTNDAAHSLGYGSLKISLPPLEVFLASKLNMIYQASINEGLIRATPLAAHYAVKSGRPRLSGADIYDFVLGAKKANHSRVKLMLKPMLVEPVNAMLDMTASALAKASAGKYFEELNNLLPVDRYLDSEAWKKICDEALASLKRIRAT